MDVGTVLREARQCRHRSLVDVAHATRVPQPLLDHIEHNEFDRLPGGILTRGHLRAYAAEVGLDPEQIVRQYLHEVAGASDDALPIARPERLETDTHLGRNLLETLAIALALVVYAVLGHSDGRSVDHPETATIPFVATPHASEVALPVAVPEDEQFGIRLEVTPSGPCWVLVRGDERVIFSRLLQRGDEAVVTAREQLVLRIGDPETFVYRLNGHVGRRLGEAGRPQSLRITETNYRSFLVDSTEPGDVAAATAVAAQRPTPTPS